MRYMGGKYRQSKKIVELIKQREGTNFKYCEPFAGGMWSATRVIKELQPSKIILSDINKSLILLWRNLISGELTLPETVTDEIYKKYQKQQDMDDPLTAWYGIACSFGGKWYGALARQERGYKDKYNFSAQVNSTMKKVEVLRKTKNLQLFCADYWDVVKNLKGWVIYLDPPYAGEKVHGFCGHFNYSLFFERVKQISKYNNVYFTCFNCPNEFTIIYDWGDTVVRHHAAYENGRQRTENKQGTEKLVIYEGGF